MFHFKSRIMEVKIKIGNEMLDAKIEMVDGVMVVSPKEVKFEPKDGDVCCSANCIYIYKSLRDDKAIIFYCAMSKSYGDITIKEDVGVGFIHSDLHYFATEEEKKKLFDKLAEEGWEWKPDTKELIKLKWKPGIGEKYYYPYLSEFNSSTGSFTWDNDKTDEDIYARSWCFKTKKECQEFCNRLNDAINSVKP